MRKKGILNGTLMGKLTELRHTDKLVICDAGIPVPAGSNVVDLSLVAGVPDMLQVLRAVLNEVIFEEYALFDMMQEMNPAYYETITGLLKEQKVSLIAMPEFQAQAKDAKLYIRTGDLAPCANILLVSASGVQKFCSRFDVTCD